MKSQATMGHGATRIRCGDIEGCATFVLFGKECCAISSSQRVLVFCPSAQAPPCDGFGCRCCPSCCLSRSFARITGSWTSSSIRAAFLDKARHFLQEVAGLSRSPGLVWDRGVNAAAAWRCRLTKIAHSARACGRLNSLPVASA
jgi:hypothetical protein